MSDAPEIVRRHIDAVRRQDLAAAERLLGEDLLFVSPEDHGLDRAGFLARRFPTASRFARQELVELHEVSPGVVVLRSVYEVPETGEVLSSMERVVVRDGRIVEIRVYEGGRDAFPQEFPVPELEADETVPPRPEEEIADAARR